MTLKTPMNKKKKRFYKLMLSQLRYDDLPEVADHLAHILEMENEKYEPEDKLFDIFSDPAKYGSVDKDHSYLTSPKVIMVSPATDVDKRKKGTPGRKKAVTPKKATSKPPETPSQITRSGRAVKANKRFLEDMEMGSDEDEDGAGESEAEISEEEPEEPEQPEPVKRGRGRPPKNPNAKAKQKESDEMVIGSITMMDNDTPKGKRGSRRQSLDDSEERRSTRSKGQDDKRKTRGSLSKPGDKGDEYLVKGKPKVIRKPKDGEDIGSRKRTHSQVDDEKANSSKKSKVSEIVDRITSKRDAKKSEEEREDEDEDEEEGSNTKSDKIDPYSSDFSVTDFATWLKDGKKSNKGWKKAGESPKVGQKKSSGRGWVKINSDSKKDEEAEEEEFEEIEEQILPTFKCDQCGAEFDGKAKLAEHKRLKHKPGIVCDHCDKRFTSKQSLAAHQQTHSGEKPYSCGVCGQRFKQKAHIGPHMLTHTGEKAFECQFCFTKFRQKSAMTEHIKRMHSDGNKPHMCKLCPIGFWSNGALQHHMKAAHQSESPSRPKTPPPKKEIVLPPPAQPEPVNLFEGKYVCSICDEKYDEMMDLADHVKTHMTQIDEETEVKNAQLAAEEKAQAMEREQIALRELEEANRLAAERAAAGEEEPKAELDIPTVMHKTRGLPIRIPPGVMDLKAGPSRGHMTPKSGTSKVPLENVVISTPSGLKFTIKASPQALKGSKYKLAAVPLKGLSQHLKSGVLKLAPSAGGGKLLAGAKGSPQQIKMRILGGEGDGSVLMSSTPGTAGVQGTILDLKDITKTAADISGVVSQDEMMSAPTFTTSMVGNDTVISVQPKEPAPPPPPPPAATDQTYYQCGDCSALFETMDAIQAHLQNDCAGANQAAAQANAAAVAQDAMPVDNLGSIPSVDASEMAGTTTIDLGQHLGQHIAPGTSLITESGTVIANPNIGEAGLIDTDPTGAVPMSSVAFDAGLQVMATAAGMTSLAPTSLHDPNEAVAVAESQQFEPDQTNEESAPLETEPQPDDHPIPDEGIAADDNAGSIASVNDPNSEAVSEASAELAGSVSVTGDHESIEGTAPEENVPVDGVGNGTTGEQHMETAEAEPTDEMLEMPVTDDKDNVTDTEGIPSTSGENIGVTQILNIPGMDTTQSIIQSMPGTSVPYEGQKMISILNQPGVVQSQNGQGDGLDAQNSSIITADAANANFENVVLGQSGDGSIVQAQEGEQLTLVDQSQAVTLPDGQQIVTYMDDNGQLAGNGAQQIQVVTTESGETYQIALPEGAASQGPMQYVTEDGQILTVKGSDLAANQSEYMVVDNGNLGGVPVTQASDNVQYVVYTSSS